MCGADLGGGDVAIQVPDGTLYEPGNADDGEMVSVGTFHMRSGDSDVVLWSGVRIAGPPIDEYPTPTPSASMRRLTPKGTRVVLVSDPTQDKVDLAVKQILHRTPGLYGEAGAMRLPKSHALTWSCSRFRLTPCPPCGNSRRSTPFASTCSAKPSLLNSTIDGPGPGQPG